MMCSSAAVKQEGLRCTTLAQVAVFFTEYFVILTLTPECSSFYLNINIKIKEQKSMDGWKTSVFKKNVHF